MDIMVDLETFGTGKRAAFVQIAAVKFTAFGAPLPVEPEPTAPTVFYANVAVDTCVKLGLQMDTDTLLWWLRDAPQAARVSLFDPAPQPVQTVLANFKRFVVWKEDFVWSKGAGFDLSILSEAYRLNGDKYGAFSFAKERDVRTVYDWGGISVEDDRNVPGEQAHNALADAWHQARMVQQAARNLGLAKFNQLALGER